MGICCMAQETQTGALYQSSRVEWVRRWKGGSKGRGCMYAAKSLQLYPTLCDPETAAHQAPPSLGFSRQEHWSGLPFPSPVHESEK